MTLKDMLIAKALLGGGGGVTPSPSNLLFDWDFTESLFDQAIGITPNLGMSATWDTNGIKFGTTGVNGYVQLPAANMDLLDKTVEIDISADSNMTTGTNQGRLFGSGNGADTGSARPAFLWRYSGVLGWTIYTGSAWSNERLDTADYPINYFAGKTVRLYFDADGYVTLSTAPIGSRQFAEIKKFADPMDTTKMTGCPVIGSSTGNNLKDLIVTGFRIYRGQNA